MALFLSGKSETRRGFDSLHPLQLLGFPLAEMCGSGAGWNAFQKSLFYCSMDKCRILPRVLSTVIVLLGSVSTLVFGAEMDRPFPQAISRNFSLPAELAG